MSKKATAAKESTLKKRHDDGKPLLGFYTEIGNAYPTFNASGYDIDAELEKGKYTYHEKDGYLEIYSSSDAMYPYIAIFESETDKKRRIILFSHEDFFSNWMNTYGFSISYGVVHRFFSREA